MSDRTCSATVSSNIRRSPGGYFDPQGGTMYYLTDWQGNNAVVADNKGNVVQETTYYPYGEPTIEPSGQRYLFGGKEREHAGGRNAYDFGARILTPYGSWSTPDPLAWKFYPLSPYSYCGGDPINYIDIVGKEKICLSSDNALKKYAQIRPDNENIAIIMHGTSYCVIDDRNVDGNAHIISKPSVFLYILCAETETYDPTQKDWVQIDLISCDTGKNNSDGSEPIAQTFSREVTNAVIKAPNGTVFFENGKMVVTDNYTITSSHSGNNYSIRYEEKKINVWRYFFRGHEINYLFIPLTKIMLFMQNHNILNKAIENIFFMCMSIEQDNVDGIPAEM